MTTLNILGGCTTRDVLECAPNNFELNEYFARTSIISMMSPAADIDHSLIDLSSSFQKRCVIRDISKTFFSELEQKKGEYIAIDFISERLNLVKIGDAYITRSNELVKSKVLDKLTGYKIAKKLDRNMQELWKKKALLFFQKLKEHFGNNIIIHKTKWRHYFIDVDGTIKEFPNKEEIEMRNEELAGYYAFVEEHFPEFIFIDMTDDRYYASAAHKWGLAPYHFEDGYYHDLLRKLSEATGTWASSTYEKQVNGRTLQLFFNTRIKSDKQHVPTLSGRIFTGGREPDIGGCDYFEEMAGFKGTNGLLQGLFTLLNDAVQQERIADMQEIDRRLDELFRRMEEEKENDLFGDSSYLMGMLITFLIRYDLTTGNRQHEGMIRQLADRLQTCQRMLPYKGGEALYTTLYYKEPLFDLPSNVMALFALHDAWRYTQDERYRSLYEEGKGRLWKVLPLYDLGDITAENLHHVMDEGTPAEYSAGFHLLNVEVLSLLASVEEDLQLKELLNNWLSYVEGREAYPQFQDTNFRLMVNRQDVTEQETIQMQAATNRFEIICNDAWMTSVRVFNYGQVGYPVLDTFEKTFSLPSDESEYTLMIQLRDRFNNRFEKSFHLINREMEEARFTQLLRSLENNTSVALNEDNLHIEVHRPLPEASYAYYVIINDEVIHKEWYSGNTKFQFPMSQHKDIETAKCKIFVKRGELKKNYTLNVNV